MHLGVLDKAEEELRFALAIDPTNESQRYRLARTYLYNAQYEKALVEFDKLSRPAWQRAVVLLHLGRMQEARSDVDTLEGRVGALDLRNKYDSDSIRALILALEGKKQEARALNQRVLDAGKGQSHLHHAAYVVASSYSLIGDHAEALRTLRLVADTGMPCYDLFLKDPYLDSLRALPEFQKFMAEQKALWERHRQVI
jgi:tetratricopeptide (TPR) repeat protein